MTTQGMTRLLMAMCCTLALAACGEKNESEPAAPPQSGGAPSREDCGAVKVSGHEAVEIRAGGVGCDAAKKVASAAEGRGRAPYESGGFACKPSEAGSGDTNYSCSMGSAKISFRYGTA